MRPPIWDLFLSISCTFYLKTGCAPPHLRQNSAPPFGKSWIRHCYVFQMDHRLKLEWYYCKEPVQYLKFVTVIPIWFQFQMEMLFKIHPDYSNFEWLSLPTTKFVTVKTFVPFQTAFWPVFMVKLFEISHFLTKFVKGNNHLFHFKQHFGMFLNVNHSKSNVVGFWTPIAELLVEQLW